ncbi:hypothetical protein NU688_16490 [Variovorax sp. ZS18.2.2]|uniref:hypothetical protein n=1 Tax=Variovorax sp. ZS18.2.2 TaxID=2971255 RepID=UPI00215105FC|nr:hypothetical protein [Variovorax sp. ZS18.2.2]MCR6477762.1 hypothetical protein [Variovorax sp. ZS18.2.2]
MPSHSETAWLHPVEAPPPAGGLSLVQRLVGLLAFSGLALGAFIAAREGGCVERHPAGARHRSPSSLSTLAPIMRTGPATPLDAVRRDAACRAQAGRSAKLKPTP